MSSRPSFALIVALAAGAGCTAAKAQLEILNAEQALHRAEEYDAGRNALYEYTMASQYLEKAREEAGVSAYRVADALARRSAQWSDRAIIFVERRGRAEIDLEGLSDRAERPVPAQDPADGPVVPDTDAETDETDETDEIDDLDDDIELEPDGGAP